MKTSHIEDLTPFYTLSTGKMFSFSELDPTSIHLRPSGGLYVGTAELQHPIFPLYVVFRSAYCFTSICSFACTRSVGIVSSLRKTFSAKRNISRLCVWETLKVTKTYSCELLQRWYCIVLFIVYCKNRVRCNKKQTPFVNT